MLPPSSQPGEHRAGVRGSIKLPKLESLRAEAPGECVGRQGSHFKLKHT